MENYKINFELETSIASLSEWYWESTFVNYLIECFIYSRADLHVIDPESELSN